MFGITKTPIDFAGSGAPSLDIRASVGTTTSPTSTGTQDIALPFQAKAFLPFGFGGTSSGATTELSLAFGAGVSTSSRAAIAVASAHGLPTSSTHRRHTAGGIVTDCFGGATNLAADLSAIAADKVTLNWSAVLGSAFLLNYIALGGADLEVSLTLHQMNGTNAPEPFAHGLPVVYGDDRDKPTGVLVFGIQNQTAPTNTTTFLCAHIGAWAGGNQWSAATLSAHGLTTTLARRLLSTSAVSNNWNGVTGVNSRSVAVSSVDATSVNVTYPVTTDTTQNYFLMLAIRGAKCQVGTFDTNGATSPYPIATPGITPKLFLPVFVPYGVDNIGVVQTDGLFFAIGASDGTNNVSCGITDPDSLPTTNARRYQSSTTLDEYNQNSTIRFSAGATFSGESVVLTPTFNAQVFFGQGGYLIIGS